MEIEAVLLSDPKSECPSFSDQNKHGELYGTPEVGGSLDGSWLHCFAIINNRMRVQTKELSTGLRVSG